MKKHSLIFSLITLLFISCEKDDICPETTQTTPRLVIEFYDLTNPDETLAVPGLFAIGLDNDDAQVPITNEIVTTRSLIALPLKTDATETEFLLYKSYDIVEGEIIGNPDKIKITYATEYVYVSRACGYKTIFDIQTFAITPDEDLWMIGSDIINEKLTNENDIHVKILH